MTVRQHATGTIGCYRKFLVVFRQVKGRMGPPCRVAFQAAIVQRCTLESVHYMCAATAAVRR